jgi:hypothetical protein
MRQWVGRTFHPEKFDLQATDKAVKTACRKARGDYPAFLAVGSCIGSPNW